VIFPGIEDGLAVAFVTAFVAAAHAFESYITWKMRAALRPGRIGEVALLLPAAQDMTVLARRLPDWRVKKRLK
jgi:hypothetical protein